MIVTVDLCACVYVSSHKIIQFHCGHLGYPKTRTNRINTSGNETVIFWENKANIMSVFTHGTFRRQAISSHNGSCLLRGDGFNNRCVIPLLRNDKKNYWMEIYKFRLSFHWTLFPKVRLTMFRYWFRWWLGAGQATSHNLNQWINMKQWVNMHHIRAPCLLSVM